MDIKLKSPLPRASAQLSPLPSKVAVPPGLAVAPPFPGLPPLELPAAPALPAEPPAPLLELLGTHCPRVVSQVGVAD
jgi:hypothetical protein